MAEILLLARLVLAGVFVVAGLAKLADPEGSRQSMADFGIPAFLEWPFVLLLPLAEVAAGVALIPVGSAWWGAAACLAMLLLFMAGMSVRLLRGERPDCHCFGKLYSTPIGGKALVREGLFGALAVFVLAEGREGSGASVTGWVRGMDGLELGLLGLAGVMAVLAAGAVWFAFYLLQQNGRMLLRMEAVEAKLGIQAEETAAAPETGLPVGSVAPGFTVESLNGDPVSLESFEAESKPVLLVFSEAQCSACDALLPDIAQSQRGHAQRLSIVVISGGDAAANRAKRDQHGLQNVLLQKGDGVLAAYQVTGTPSAVLVRDGKIASPVASGGGPIRALLARATLPPIVKKGDASPELRLPDVSGTAVNLAELRDRRTLILFWNPSCGFCRQLQPDVKSWEQSWNEESPELLVISSGSLEEIRKEGFRARVLLDQNFAAGQVFDVEGTPAAVMIDETGRVASEVAVGGPDVLALVGATRAKGREQEMQASVR